jgi:hypothetical protein
LLAAVAVGWWWVKVGQLAGQWVLMADGCYVGYAAWLSSAHVANYVLGGCWSLMLDVLSKGKAYTT